MEEPSFFENLQASFGRCVIISRVGSRTPFQTRARDFRDIPLRIVPRGGRGPETTTARAAASLRLRRRVVMMRWTARARRSRPARGRDAAG